MGRPPTNGGPVFRFTPKEVVEMEACLQEVNNAIPSRDTIVSLSSRFSESAERAGKITVQPKQVWNWFQNRRYAQRAKMVKIPGLPAKLNVSPMPRDDVVPFKNAGPIPAASDFFAVVPGRTTQPEPARTVDTPAKSSSDTPQVEFEAKSARDGAWYDVACFLSHRMFETGDPEVRVRFTGFGVEEDEWINVCKFVRQRSLPCEAGECIVVLPGDLVLCFQEGREQALYYDAHVLDAQRRRHDVRGCRCRFLVRYDHDQSEEIVPLRKICRRPETDYRLQMLPASRTSELRPTSREPSLPGPSKDANMTSPPKARKHRKLMDVNTDEVTTVPVVGSSVENNNQSAADAPMEDAAATTGGSADKPQEGNAAGN